MMGKRRNAKFQAIALLSATFVLASTACSGSVSSPVVAVPDSCSSGHPFKIEVFRDALHTQRACGFSRSKEGAAYVYVPNVAPSDHYVMYVESAGAHPSCVYVTPQPNAGNAGCNPRYVNGVQAPGGSISLTWPIASSLAAGTYTITVYDKTAGAGATVRVAVTGT